MPPLEPTLVLPAFDLVNARFERARSGFSGATVWKFRTTDGSFALKAYPQDWGNGTKLMAQHDWVMRAGDDLLPQPRRAKSGRTLVETQYRIWELVDWRNGRPADEIGVVLPAVARLHQAWSAPRLADTICPTVQRQLAVLHGWLHRPVANIDHPSWQSALDLLYCRLVETVAELRPWLARPVPVQTVHGDLWPGNVLVDQQRLSGIIDFASMRVDSVVSDLTRLCGPTSAESNRLIAERYEPTRPLQPVEWELLKTLGITGPVARLAQWLQWLLLDHRHFDDATAAHGRFAEVVRQAQA